MPNRYSQRPRYRGAVGPAWLAVITIIALLLSGCELLGSGQPNTAGTPTAVAQIPLDEATATAVAPTATFAPTETPSPQPTSTETPIPPTATPTPRALSGKV